MKLLAVLLFIPTFSFAAIDVAFIEVKNYGGQVVRLEKGGQFAHIAISYQGQWLHSHPLRGVEVVSQDVLEEIGSIRAFVTISDKESLNKAQVETFLGKPYDPEFSWGDEKMYCSELVAKLLKIEPEPMAFESAVWSQHSHQLRGQLGLSPDDIFRILKQRGYRFQ